MRYLKRKTKFIIVVLLLLPFCLRPITALAKETVPKVKVNGKTVNNAKLQLDTRENYVILKGNYDGCTLKTDSKKVKIKYWGITSSGKEWEIITKESGKAKVMVVRDGKTIKSFALKVKTPKLVVKGNNSTLITLKLKGAGENQDGNTLHNVKWFFKPVGHYGSRNKTIKEVIRSNETFMVDPGTYKVSVKLLGKTYKLKKEITVLECKGDFSVQSISEMEKVLPGYVTKSLRLHGYSFSIVGKRTLDHFSKGLKSEHTISGIHDLEQRKIAVSNTSATVVLHEVGHFVSCSFQKVNGVNLTQTTEWQKIYERERTKFCQPNGFSQVGDTYAATSANEFFAECFQQFYLAPKTLRKHCPQAYKFVKQTVKIDFPKIANVAW